MTQQPVNQDRAHIKGMLLVDKPTDWTSFDAVNYVRKFVAQYEGKKPKNVKVGHCGTLDPFATGLLILLVGKEYTRRAEEFSKLDKTYIATLKLGESSSTGDPEGEITVASSPEVPTQEQFEAACAKFVGEIEQIPPAFSAIKVDGQRAYKLARAGKEVIIQPRKTTINSLKVTSYNYPEATIEVDVSSGTYIRTLVEDIAKSLNTTAYTTQLRRTKIDKQSVDNSVQVQNLSIGTIIEHLELLQ
jgi:tRNA pseudouridine55 synthase